MPESAPATISEERMIELEEKRAEVRSMVRREMQNFFFNTKRGEPRVTAERT